MKQVSYFVLFFFFIGSMTSQSISEMTQRSNLDPVLEPFYHGVASGDPLPTSVIIWTRVSPDVGNTADIPITWRMATDTGMTNIVKTGSGLAKSSQDHTFKVDVTGLQQEVWYYYDFEAKGKRSIRGRTRTSPSGSVSRARIAVVSCSNWQHGWFDAYHHIAERNDVDAVLHLGDYIYEYKVGTYSYNLPNRDTEPVNEIVTLDDYRMRYSHYRLDKDLRDIHQQYPFMVVWDDHDFANNAYLDGAANHDPGTQGSWIDRKANAKQSFHEWMPIRENVNGVEKIYRHFTWGDLFSLYMLDTRMESRMKAPSVVSGSDLTDPSMRLIGDAQFNWLKGRMNASTTKWNLLGNQVMMVPLQAFGQVVNTDQWDGYQYERSRLLNFIETNQIDNPIVLTGDVHSNWVADIPKSGYSTSDCSTSYGAELIVTSVTSHNTALPVSESIIKFSNPHFKYVDATTHGYMIVDMNQSRLECNYYKMNDVTNGFGTYGEQQDVAFRVLDGQNCVKKITTFASSTGYPILAPTLPQQDQVTSVADRSRNNNLTFFGVSPNPTSGDLLVQLHVQEEENVTFGLYDNQGKVVMANQTKQINSGMVYYRMDISSVPSGNYFMHIMSEKSKLISIPIIKE